MIFARSFPEVFVLQKQLSFLANMRSMDVGFAKLLKHAGTFTVSVRL